MPSAIWTGTIGFGLVQVPVRLVSATKTKDVRFNQLEAGTGARIRYRKVSEQSGEEVSQDQIVKGYELGSGSYVVIENSEIAALAPKASHTIEIEEFVDLDEIDPIYFENPYYLAPDQAATKPYRLLVEAMEKLGKVAIGRIVMRSKERLVAIRTLDGVLCIETMRYADEILDRAELVGDDAELTEKERTMARQLVESLAADSFEPEKYHDEYREQLMGLIDRKAAGEEIVAPQTTEKAAQVLDLVAALEQSLERAAANSGKGGAKTSKAQEGAQGKPKAKRRRAKSA